MAYRSGFIRFDSLPHEDYMIPEIISVAPHPIQHINARPVSGAHRLCVAILKDAVDQYRTFHPSRKYGPNRLFREVEYWFETRKHDDWPFTFTNICAALSIEPDWFYPRLKALNGGHKIVIANPQRWGQASMQIVTKRKQKRRVSNER